MGSPQNLAAAVIAFVGALTNLLVQFELWHPTSGQLSSVNGIVLTGLGLYAVVRAQGFSSGRLLDVVKASPVQLQAAATASAQGAPPAAVKQAVKDAA